MINDQYDDEIDLRELFLTLWRGKWVIMVLSVLAIAAASVYLHRADRLYTVTMTVKPVNEDQSGPNLGGLGGLASLAGVSLPTGGASEFGTFKALLTSEKTAQQLMANTDLVRAIFQHEWSEESGSFAEPKRTGVSVYIPVVKKVLTGDDGSEYRAPDAQRLSEFLSENVSISENKDSGFLNVSMEIDAPEIAVRLMPQLVEKTDRFLKTAYIESGTSALQFYQEKIARARSQEHREALAKMIGAEEQKQMLASRDGPYVAEILLGPSVSLGPTSPKASLVLALAFVLGTFLGAAVVLIRAAFKGNGTTLDA